MNIWHMCFYCYIKYSSPICLLFLQRRSLQHGHTFPDSVHYMLAIPMSTLLQLQLGLVLLAHKLSSFNTLMILLILHFVKLNHLPHLHH
jgi:hypothetical protein